MRDKLVSLRNRLLIACLACLLPAIDVIAQPLRFYAEESPPLLFKTHDGLLTGASVDIVDALLKQTGMQGNLLLVPWARAVKELAEHPNVVLVTIGQSPERENQVQWIGHIYRATGTLMSLKDNPAAKIESLEQARKLVVGTVRGYRVAQYLLDNGFSENNNLILTKDQRQLWSLLFLKRLDLVLHDSNIARFDMRFTGFDSTKVEDALHIEDLYVDLKMATGLQTDKRVVEELRTGLAAIKSSGEFARIMAHWSLSK